MSKTKWYQKPIYLLVALALVLSLGIAALPMARTVGAATAIYVNSSTENDSWDGQSPEWDGTHGPKRTIQVGITVVGPGGTVHVAVHASPPGAPTSPLCEGVHNPTGVTDPTPEFSWNFSDPDAGDTQGAYRILVASTVANLASDTGDMWDSGKVNSSASEVSYAGTALAENETYYWKVMTWDNNGEYGPYCVPGEFSTGTFPSPSEVWVDDDYCDGCPNDGHTWGYDAFDKIQDGIDAVANSTVHVAAGTYAENITLKDGVEVLGAGADVTTIDGGGGGSVVFGSGVGSTTKLDGFTITNGSYQYGGGIFLRTSSSPTISNCIFSGNWAFWGGGMFNHQGSSPTVTNCIFSGNSASCGGGMYNRLVSSPTVTNCIFLGNSAGSGGGMSNSISSRPTVTNCIFSGNSATTSGGIWNYDFSRPTVTNCILWDNGQEIYNDFLCTPVVTYCDIQGGYPGVTNIDADPMFVDSANNDYHSRAGSPCIDAGTNEGTPAEDIEGNARPADGDNDGTATTDMGAYEHVPPAPSPPPPVGGEARPVNKASVLAPWIALAVLLAGGAGWLALRHRRTQS